MVKDPLVPFLDCSALRQLSRGHTACEACSSLRCDGWEALSGAFDRSRLRRIGTLRPRGDDEPTLQEYHPAQTHAWSADAPIAPAFYPYNRCEVWCCAECARPFLRYTEYGGYYEEERIRELKAELVTDAQTSA